MINFIKKLFGFKPKEKCFLCAKRNDPKNPVVFEATTDDLEEIKYTVMICDKCVKEYSEK